MSEAHNKLYPRCSEFSSLNFLVKLMHVKVLNGWSNKSFDMLLELLRAAFSMCSSTILSSFYEAKQKLRDLGLGYETIKACKYDCVLYWKEFVDLQHCPTCGEARYKVNHNRGKKIPHKVLRHFPLVPRLQRLFVSQEGSADMRWHRDKRVETDDVLSIQLMQRGGSTLILNFLILLLIHEMCVWAWLQMGLTHLVK